VNQQKEIHKKGTVIGDVELVVVYSDEESLCKIVEEYDYSGLTKNLVKNTGDTDFASQVNLGVSKSTHKWVSIIEFDDEYSSIWFKNVYRYINSYDDVGVFLPIVVDTDSKGLFVGFTNEASFAANINEEIGYLTNDTLLSYQNFQTSGMVFKKELFNDFGGFKKSIKLTFVYELLLRLTHNSVKIMTIPKIGYKHVNLREGSIFWNYKNGQNRLTDDEVKFWIESSKKEYFFIDDRNIKYEYLND
jgi:GT2 family glycosyltransferase